MKIIGVSGDGIGAGKSSFCRKLTNEVWSLAGALRDELKRVCPEYDWFNKSQEYKNQPFTHSSRLLDKLGCTTLENLPRMRTVRDAMIVYGQRMCEQGGDNYWVRELTTKLDTRLHIMDGCRTIGIDDVRKVVEIEHLREKYHRDFIHFHLVTAAATAEPQFENEQLKQMADYTVSWEK